MIRSVSSLMMMSMINPIKELGNRQTNKHLQLGNMVPDYSQQPATTDSYINTLYQLRRLYTDHQLEL
jgi:hypothetical protein